MFKRIRAYFEKKSLDSTSRKKIKFIEGLIRTSVNSPHLYLRALRHRSKLIESQLADFESYEQLEFLGDAVLDLLITEIIFEHFPEQNEGFMTKLRSRLVKEDTLANLSIKLELPGLIEVGSRVKSQGIELKNSVLCDIFEALLGAVYLDLGIKTTRSFIKRVYQDHIDIIDLSETHDNYKSQLLEYTQAQKLSIPEYVVRKESGPDHDKTFEIEVVINEQTCGTGIGKNKKKAEQAAAMEAMAHFQSGVITQN